MRVAPFAAVALIVLQGTSPRDDGQWTMPGRDYAATRYSGLSQITARNAARIRPVWSFSTSRCSASRSEEHTSELQSPCNLVCRLLLEKKKKNLSAGPGTTSPHRAPLTGADDITLASTTTSPDWRDAGVRPCAHTFSTIHPVRVRAPVR